MALHNSLGSVFSTAAFRLTAAILATFMVLAAIVAFLLFRQTNDVLSEQVIATLKAEAATLSREAEMGGLAGLTEAVRVRSRPEGPGLYYLGDDRGNKLAGNLNRVPPELNANPEGGVFRYERGSGASARTHLAVAIPAPIIPVPLTPAPWTAGTRLVVGRDVEEQRVFAERIKRIFLGGFSILTLAGLLGGLAISRLVMRRIETMTSASRSIMAGDLSQRIPLAGSGDELDDLASSLNVMLERIEQLMMGLKEVSDNIAHDLKTPLNRLRNRAEAALRDPRGDNAHKEGLERTIEEADELIKTFNALLLIARLEAGAVEENSETFDLGALVQDVAELYQPVAEEAGLSLAVEIEQGPEIRANKQLIGQAVANLIDNAMKYGTAGAKTGVKPAGPSIAVKVSLSEGETEISVSDRGPGISAADRERVLKRFVRLEQSRTAPGTGLGLSLVAAVARLHKGAVRLEDNAPGLRVVLSLPVSN
jgi:signal transduction histidine kinase